MQVTPMPPISNKKTGVLRRGVFTKSRVLYVSLCGIQFINEASLHSRLKQARSNDGHKVFR